MADMDGFRNDDGDIVMELSEAKKNRWIRRIQKALFESYETLEDGSYQGLIKEEVIEIIKSNFPLNDRMGENELVDRIGKTVTDIASFIEANTNGVHEVFITHFALDFVQQSISSIFQIQETDPPSDTDFMYG
jgi:hypothetical protein